MYPLPPSTHSVGTGVPSFRAHLAMDVGVLESLDQPQHLIHRPAHLDVVDHGTTQDTLLVNDEQRSI